MTPHNQAAKGDYADIVLLPGDPLRAKWIAETFLEAPRLVNQVRSCFGYTGSYRGRPVSVQATGMGQPSLAIYVHELLDTYGCRTLIRVGTCGGLAEKVKVRDIVLAQTASTNSGMNRAIFGAYDYAPCADFGLLSRAALLAAERGLPCHVGGIVSDDVFYKPDPIGNFAQLVAHGALAVEMESSTLYTLAARFQARALTVCSVSDSLVSGEEMEPLERQSALDAMVRLSLDTAVAAS